MYMTAHIKMYCKDGWGRGVHGPSTRTEFVVVFLLPSRQMQGEQLKLCDERFLPRSYQFIIHEST
jgi:hypothetical protein